MERFGLKLMSIGFLLEDEKQAVVWRGPMLHGALNQFLKDVDWGGLDYLILDLPPGTGDVALTIAQRIKTTGAVIVTTPQEVALQDVYKSVSMCQKLSIPVLGVIENMSWFVDTAGVRHELFGAGGGQKIADTPGAAVRAGPADPRCASGRAGGDRAPAPESGGSRAPGRRGRPRSRRHFRRWAEKAPRTDLAQYALRLREIGVERALSLSCVATPRGGLEIGLQGLHQPAHAAALDARYTTRAGTRTHPGARRHAHDGARARGGPA
jgi:hypothetical protein